MYKKYLDEPLKSGDERTVEVFDRCRNYLSNSCLLLDSFNLERRIFSFRAKKQAKVLAQKKSING
jgi:hypothetical protein